MPVIHAVGPRSTDTTDTRAESVLQHFYFIVAIAIVFVLAFLRIIILRRRNQALSNFFRIGSNSQYAYGSYPPYDTSPGSMYHGTQLARPPAVYHSDRRIRAVDTDALGRRLGPAGEEWEGKDALPAYDNFDRPPKYIEAGWSHGRPPRSTEQSAVTTFPEGEQSGMSHPDTANDASRDNVNPPLDNTSAVAGAIQESEAPIPPSTHNGSSSS